MKQKNLVKEMYEACVSGNAVKRAQLLKKEFSKIIKKKQQGKIFTAKWTVVR